MSPVNRRDRSVGREVRMVSQGSRFRNLQLDPWFKDGWLVPPGYMPSWAADLRCLAAMSAFSAFIANVRLDAPTVDRAIEFEAEHGADGGGRGAADLF